MRPFYSPSRTLHYDAQPMRRALAFFVLPLALGTACAGAQPTVVAKDPNPDDFWGGKMPKVPVPKSSVSGAKVAPPPVVDPEVYKALAATRAYKFGTPQHAEVTPDGLGVFFLQSGPRDPKQSLYKLDLRTGETRQLVSPEALIHGPETMSPQERARRERMRVTAAGITSFEITGDSLGILIPLSGKLFFFDRMTGLSRELPTDEGTALDPHLSPDGKYVAFVRNNDVRIITTDGKSTEQAVTRGGTEARPHGVAEFVAQEEFDRPRGFFFSPDGDSIAFEEPDQSKMEQLAIVDPAHPEHDDKSYYPRAGTPNAEVRWGITAAHGAGSTVWINWDRDRYPYVATARWDKGAPFTMVVVDRAQKNLQVLSVDAKTGQTRALVSEHDDAYVNVDPSVPRWLPDGTAFYWSSEHSGNYELEEIQVPKTGGTVARVIVPKEVGYRALVDVDPVNKRLVFTGGAEPSEQLCYSVALGGGAAEPIKPMRGVIEPRFGENHDVFVAYQGTPNAYPKWYVHTIGKTDQRELPQTAEKPAWVPQIDLRKVGPNEVRTVVVKPRNFVAGRKYPVIDAAYGGPGAKVAVADAYKFIRAQILADATGAIVVSIDGRGTPHRSRAWERATYGKLNEIPVLDHIETIRALAADIPEIDLGRVGVTGWSFGGTFAGTAVLSHPDFYKAGVAGAPVTDWRDYDSAYSERYMGMLPDAKAAYDAQSLLTMASAATPSRPLLLIHGTADDNVYFANTLKLVDALTRAHKPFEVLPLLGQTHLVADPALNEVVSERSAEFLRSALSSDATASYPHYL